MKSSKRMQMEPDLLEIEPQGLLLIRYGKYRYQRLSSAKRAEYQGYIDQTIQRAMQLLSERVKHGAVQGTSAKQAHLALGTEPTTEQIKIFAIGKTVLKHKSRWPMFGNLRSLYELAFGRRFDVDTLGVGFDNCLYVSALVKELTEANDIGAEIEGGYTLWGRKNELFGTHYLVKTEQGNICDPLMAFHRNGLVRASDKPRYYEEVVREGKRLHISMQKKRGGLEKAMGITREAMGTLFCGATPLAD